MDYMDRHSDNDINKLIFERWSPRSYKNKSIEEDKLNSILEAARWAPSCFNEQPWRFIVAQSSEDRERVIAFLADANKAWCNNVPVFITVISRADFAQSGKQNRWNGFDAGCSWGYIALEARRQGLYAHAMGGFDRLKAKEALKIPEGFEVYAVIALGERDIPEVLSEKLREREKPSDRKPLKEIVFYGLYSDK
ncbi:MAG: nitroreductase family protein [Bacillota bacterium]